MNRIQNLRKDSGFDVTDKVSVEIYADGEDYAQIEASLASFGEYLASQTLARGIVLKTLAEAGEGAADVEWDTPLKIKVTKIS